MSVVRIKHRTEQPFVMLSRETLRTSTLSLKARGLWAVCMSYPDAWEFNVPHLSTASDTDGKSAVRSALKELEAAGLATLDDVRNEDGTMAGKRWTIYETPELCAEAVELAKPNPNDVDRATDVQVFRTSGKPNVGKSDPML